jgi:hypothetical protein
MPGVANGAALLPAVEIGKMYAVKTPPTREPAVGASAAETPGTSATAAEPTGITTELTGVVVPASAALTA